MFLRFAELHTGWSEGEQHFKLMYDSEQKLLTAKFNGTAESIDYLPSVKKCLGL